MESFRHVFEAYGADYAATLARFMNRETAYLRFLDMLFQDGSLQKLGDALACGNLNGAFEAAHTLKGVAGNMGLTPLYNAVCGLVEPLRAREARGDYPALYQAVVEEFERVDALRKALKEVTQA